MTAQFGERLRFRGDDYEMFANPLNGYDGSLGPLPQFVSTSTACWRGYVGTWEFRDDILHLTNIYGSIEDYRSVGMADVFPGRPGGARADWCTDLLRLPVGEQLQYVHMGYGSTYERDLMLVVDRGRLVYLEEIDQRLMRVARRELTPHADRAFNRDHAAFVRGVADAGWSDAPKLVYADYLDELGDARGELIRVEVERGGLAKGDPRRTDLAARRRELYSQADWVWVKAMGFSLPIGRWGTEEVLPQRWERIGQRDADFWDRTLADVTPVRPGEW